MLSRSRISGFTHMWCPPTATTLSRWRSVSRMLFTSNLSTISLGNGLRRHNFLLASSICICYPIMADKVLSFNFNSLTGIIWRMWSWARSTFCWFASRSSIWSCRLFDGKPQERHRTSTTRARRSQSLKLWMVRPSVARPSLSVFSWEALSSPLPSVMVIWILLRFFVPGEQGDSRIDTSEAYARGRFV